MARRRRQRPLTDFIIFEGQEVWRGIKNSDYFFDSWTWSHFNSVASWVKICFDQERFLKLFDLRIWSTLFSLNSRDSTIYRYFTIKGVVFFVVGSLIYRINNRNMVERKNVYLIGLLPIPMNSIGSRNDTLEESFGSANINRLIVSLLYLPKGKEIESGQFPKYLSGYSSISRLFTEREKQMNNHLLTEEIEELLGNPTRSIRSFFSDRWSELHLGSSPTERFTRDQKLLKKEQDVSLIPSRRSENKEMVNIFKIITYLQKTVSIHPISSDRGCDMVPKDEPNMDSSNKISFLNNNPFFSLFPLFHDRNRGGYTLRHDFESEERFQEMADLFTLSITEPDLVYHKGFAFSMDSYGLDQKQFLNEVFNSRDESKKKSLWVLPPIFYEENASFYQRIRKKWLRISCGNFLNYLKDTKDKIVVFASNNRMEAVNQYRLIRTLIQIQYRIYESFFMNRSHHNFEYGIQWDQIGNDTLNHRTRMKYTINQHLSNLKKSPKKWFDSLIWISRSERSMNRDPDAYRYKCFNGSHNFQEHFEHFVSEQKSPFQVVFDRLRINQYWIDWSKVINKKNVSKSLFLSKWILFLSNSLPFFFVSLGNMPIHRSEIHIYELKGPNDQLCNPLLKSLGLQIVHLKKWKAEDHDTSQKSKLLINGRTISPFLFNKIPKWKWMIDSFHTRKNRRKSFDNRDSYFSMIFRDQDNWLNPVKAFHRSSLISAFYKVNKLRFLNNPHHFFYCNKGFPFYMEKARINNSDFTYRKFLNIFFIRNPIFSLCGGKKKHAFLERDTISPIESNIFISNDFPQRGDERYNLYKSFHFPIRSDLFVRRTSYSIADISGTPVTEEERVNLERTYCQPLSDMSLSDSERKNLHRYLNFHTPPSEKSLPSAKRKKRNLRRKKCVKKGQMDRILQRDLFLPKWNLFQTSLPFFFTSTGYKYIKCLCLDTLSDLRFFNIFADPLVLDTLSYLQNFDIVADLLSSNSELVSRLKDIRHRSVRSWRILKIYQREWPILLRSFWMPILRKCLRKLRRMDSKKIFAKLFHEFLQKFYEIISRKKELPLTLRSTNLSSPNARELLYSILLLLLLAGYLVQTYLMSVSKNSSELHTEFEGFNSLMKDGTYMKELAKLLNRIEYRDGYEYEYDFEELRAKSEDEKESCYLRPEPTYFRFQFSWKRKLESWHKIFFNEEFDLDVIDIPIPSTIAHIRFYWVRFTEIMETLFFAPTDLLGAFLRLIIRRIGFSIDAIYLSHRTKEIYLWLRKGKHFHTPDKIESWILKTDWILFKSRAYLMQASTFSISREKGMNQILLGLTYSDHLLKNDSGYEMVEQPGAVYLRYLVDMHQKGLINYEFNTSCLAERRIFLAHYQTGFYSKLSYELYHFDSHSYAQKPFSLRLHLAPYKGILVVGSVGTGRSHLVRSLATNSYLPFVPIVLEKPPLFSYLGLDDCVDVDEFFGALEVLDIEGIDKDDSDKCLDEFFKNESMDSDGIDDDIDLNWELGGPILMDGGVVRDVLDLEPHPLCIWAEFEFARAMSPCIAWIANLHYLYLDYLEEWDTLALLMNYCKEDLYSNTEDYERWSTSEILVIASTHIPQKVDPALVGKLTTRIKIRKPLIPQQRKHLFNLSYTKGFHLETTNFENNGVCYIAMAYRVPELVKLNHEAVALSMSQDKSIIDINTIRHTLHKLTWELKENRRPVPDYRVIFYQLGRAFAQNVFLNNLNNSLIDPISIFVNKMRHFYEGESYAHKWFFELGTNMKRFTIFLYLFSCSAGSVAQGLWEPARFFNPEKGLKKDWLFSFRFVQNDSYIVEVLLEVEVILVGVFGKELSYNDRVKAPHPFDRLQGAYRSWTDRELLYESDSIARDERLYNLMLELFDETAVSPRRWQPTDFLYDSLTRPTVWEFPYWSQEKKGVFYAQDGSNQDESKKDEFEIDFQDGSNQDESKKDESKKDESDQDDDWEDGWDIFEYADRDEFFAKNPTLAQRKHGSNPDAEADFHEFVRSLLYDEDVGAALGRFLDTFDPYTLPTIVKAVEEQDRTLTGLAKYLKFLLIGIKDDEIFPDPDRARYIRIIWHYLAIEGWFNAAQEWARPYYYDPDVDDVDEVREFYVSLLMGGPKEQLVFRSRQFFWDPGDPLFFLNDDFEGYEELPLDPLFSSHDLITKNSKRDLYFGFCHFSDFEYQYQYKYGWFITQKKLKYCDLWINLQRRRWERISRLLVGKESFRSNIQSEIAQYLSNLFLSNERLVDEMRKTLWRKRWLFPDDLKVVIKELLSGTELTGR